jgi:hypothetical protein
MSEVGKKSGNRPGMVSDPPMYLNANSLTTSRAAPPESGGELIQSSRDTLYIMRGTINKKAAELFQRLFANRLISV